MAQAMIYQHEKTIFPAVEGNGCVLQHQAVLADDGQGRAEHLAALDQQHELHALADAMIAAARAKREAEKQ